MDEGIAMEPDVPVIQSVVDVAVRFSTELTLALPEWEERLKENPSDLEGIEREVHILAARGADMVVAGLILAGICLRILSIWELLIMSWIGFGLLSMTTCPTRML